MDQVHILFSHLSASASRRKASQDATRSKPAPSDVVYPASLSEGALCETASPHTGRPERLAPERVKPAGLPKVGTLEVQKIKICMTRSTPPSTSLIAQCLPRRPPDVVGQTHWHQARPCTALVYHSCYHHTTRRGYS